MSRRVPGLRDDLRNTWEVLLRPGATFRRFRSRSPWLAAWIVGSALSVGLTVLTLSVAQRAAVHLAARVDSPNLAGEMQSGLRSLWLISVAGAPAGLLVRWTLVSLVLWAPATLATPRARYRGVFSVIAHSALPGLFGKGLDLAVAWTQGPELTPELVPVLSSAASLGAFLPVVQTPWPAALLDRLTVFAVWEAALWIVGLRESMELGPRRAAVVAVPVWILLLVSGASLDVIGRSMTSGALPGR